MAAHLKFLNYFILKMFLLVFLFSYQMNEVHAELGILNATSSESHSSQTYCIAYNPSYRPLPISQKDPFKLTDILPSDGCRNETTEYHQAVVMEARGNCTFSEKAFIAQKNGASGVLIVSEGNVVTPHGNSTDYSQINIIVAVIVDEDAESIQKLGSDIDVYLYSPEENSLNLDYSLVIIWVLAVLCVTLGSYWSGYESDMERKLDAAGQGGNKKQDTVNISPLFIVFFVILMCSMLLLLYFFYDYLVFAAIALFCVASAFSLYQCLAALLSIFSSCARNRMICCGKAVSLKHILIAALSIGLAVWWAIERNEWYAFILQDILGFAFCINMLVVLKMPSFKACTILLLLLFVYDIFFVFITPLFTKNGESVMVDVATGGSSQSKEQLPMVLKVPHLNAGPLSICGIAYSLLGFGDILVPGLLVAYCHNWDLKVDSKRIYFVANSIAYGIGLLLTFIGLALMETGQPALLYLVPCLMVTTVIIACYRGEIEQLWHGDFKCQHSDQGTAEQGPVGVQDRADSESIDSSNVSNPGDDASELIAKTSSS